MREILALFAEHAPQGLDYVSVFMFLNTVAGGHYEERYPEAEIRAALKAALERGWLAPEGDGEAGPRPGTEPAAGPGAGRLHLTDSGRTTLAS